MFQLEEFIAGCRAARDADPTHHTMLDRMRAAMADPAAIIRTVGEPTRAGVETLYRAPDLTILNLVWGPYMSLRPHDHHMWAVIGIYTGREDNIFWRRIAEVPGRIEAAGAMALSTGDAVPLGRDLIHSVVNPIPRLTGALHVYAGDFFDTERSEWDAESLSEQPYQVATTLRLFEESNARLAP